MGFDVVFFLRCFGSLVAMFLFGLLVVLYSFRKHGNGA